MQSDRELRPPRMSMIRYPFLRQTDEGKRGCLLRVRGISSGFGLKGRQLRGNERSFGLLDRGRLDRCA